MLLAGNEYQGTRILWRLSVFLWKRPGASLGPVWRQPSALRRKTFRPHFKALIQRRKNNITGWRLKSDFFEIDYLCFMSLRFCEEDHNKNPQTWSNFWCCSRILLSDMPQHETAHTFGNEEHVLKLFRKILQPMTQVAPWPRIGNPTNLP